MPGIYFTMGLKVVDGNIKSYQKVGDYEELLDIEFLYIVKTDNNKITAIYEPFICGYYDFVLNSSGKLIKIEQCSEYGNSDLMPSVHIHNFMFTADSTVLKAYCTETEKAEDCIYHGSESDLTNAIALTLTASATNYAGQAATITIGTEDQITAWESADLLVPTKIFYETSEGEELGETAPTTVGFNRFVDLSRSCWLKDCLFSNRNRQYEMTNVMEVK